MISASTGVSADLRISWLRFSGELPLPVDRTEALVVNGSSYDYTVTCTPSGGSKETGTVSFTATTQELLRFYPSPDGPTSVETFTLQLP